MKRTLTKIIFIILTNLFLCWASVDVLVTTIDNPYDNTATLGSWELNSKYIIQVKLYSLSDRFAKGGVLRQESGGVYSYPVTFILDENGIWKIMGF